MQSEKLMIPGPVEVDDDVLGAMGAPVAVHYGPKGTALYNETTSQLKQVFRTEGDVFILVSSGSGGVEAAVASLFAPGELVAIVVNGFFGERLASIAELRGLQVVRVVAPWGEPVDPAQVRTTLSQHRQIAGLLAVSVETSTGVLNPLQSLGALAQEFNVPFAVDAVSSLGGEELAMDEWGIDVCVTASQKCLEAPPGLAPVAVSRRAWEIMDRKDNPYVGWYLNLKIWRQYAQEWGAWHPFPITMATSNVRALHVSLGKLLAEGLERRIARYHQAAQFFRAGLGPLGFSLFVEGAAATSVLTAVRRLPGLNVAELVTFLNDRYNIHIAGGLGATRGEIFRVGHMGQACSPESISLLLEALNEFLQVSDLARSPAPAPASPGPRDGLQ